MFSSYLYYYIKHIRTIRWHPPLFTNCLIAPFRAPPIFGFYIPDSSEILITYNTTKVESFHSTGKFSLGNTPFPPGQTDEKPLHKLDSSVMLNLVKWAFLTPGFSILLAGIAGFYHKTLLAIEPAVKNIIG